MYRSEKRNKFIGFMIVLLLLLTIPAVWVRLLIAKPALSGADISRTTGVYGTILDRDGNVIADSITQCPEIWENLVGNVHSTGTTMAAAFKNSLAPEIPFLRGIKGIESGNTLNTALLEQDAQEAIADAFGSKSGACFAYNYKTGAVLCALSVDGETTFGGNRCLRGLYTPGSTMKVVTSILAIEGNPEFFDSFCVECDGEILRGGIRVACSGVHGKTNGVKALGESCNIAYGSIATELDDEAVKAGLEKMGFSLNTADRTTLDAVNGLKKSCTTTEFLGDGGYNDIWGLIGQGRTLVNLSDMAKIAGAIANGGSAAKPLFGLSIQNPKGKEIWSADVVTDELFSASTAEIMDRFWTEAYETYYGDGIRQLDPIYSYVKTGTAQVSSGVNKLLLGVSKETATAFIIVVEDYEQGDPAPNEIANVLADYLPREAA